MKAWKAPRVSRKLHREKTANALMWIKCGSVSTQTDGSLARRDAAWDFPAALTSIRHPEARAQRASKDDGQRTGRSSFEGRFAATSG
jgi:hypothetical protein